MEGRSQDVAVASPVTGVGPVTDELPGPEAAAPGRRRRALVVEALGATWVPWLAARVVTLSALALAKFEVSHFHITNAKAVLETRDGLLGSDAGWYQAIAAHGYGALPRSALRFFPLLPLLDRGLHLVTALTVGMSSLLVVNVSSLLVAVGIYVLVVVDLADTTLARRSAWLVTLAPPAFVFVMGYSDALLVALAVAVFVCVRRGHWWWAVPLGYLAGTSRPIGCLLAVPVVVEAVRTFRVERWARWPAKVGAVVAPVAGAATYLGWVAAEFGDFFAPLRIQEQAGHHGALSDPFVTVYHALRQFLHGDHVGIGLHLPWIVVAVGLLMVAFRRLPVSYGLFAICIVVAGLSGSNLDSFERYLLSAFPLVVAGATLLRSPRVAATVFVLCGAAMVAYAVLAFQGAYVP